MPPRKRLGQLLTELGVIDEHQLQSALGHQKQWGGKLGSVLVQKGFCKEPDVVAALSKHLGMPQVKLADAKIDPRAVKFVSKQIAEKLHVFPYELSGGGRGEVVTVAMSDPTDLSAVDQLAFHTGKRIKPMLAGDTEIVQAIQTHYAEEKKPAPPAAQPKPVTGQMAPVPAAQAAPAAAVGTQFPRRIGPDSATPAAGTPRAAPYIPPPIPAAAPKPAQKLDEIEPDESISAAAAPPPRPEPVDLPEDDGQMMGLEPIAAHSQFGDEVSGQEEVAGEGSAADAVEGLESASVKHEGVEEASRMEGLEPIAAHSQAAEPEGGWGAEATPPAEGWTAEPAAPWDQTAETPAPEAAGWAEETPAPAVEPEAAADWGGGESGWTAEGAAPAGTPSEAPDELPMDAIIGTAETAEGTPAQPAGWGTEEPPPAPQESAPEEQAAPPEEAPPPSEEAALPSEEATAPDAWASSEDPLAAAGEAPPAWSEAPAEEPQPEPAPEAPAEETAAEAAASEEAAVEASASEEAAPEAPLPEEAAPEAPPPEEAAPEAPPPEEAAPPTDEPTPQEMSPEARPITDKFGTDASAEAAEQSATAETEAPPEWGEQAEEPAAPAEEGAAAMEEAPPSEEFSEEQSELKLEGWIAPPPEPEPQGAGWFGQALEATTPLSSADVTTLASLGVDPNDGVGALRLLAAMVRVLNRGQQVDPLEVALEVRESRQQAAAEYAAAQATDGEPQPESQEADQSEQTPAEPAEPAET